jgi:hypothetical protein
VDRSPSCPEAPHISQRTKAELHTASQCSGQQRKLIATTKKQTLLQENKNKLHISSLLWTERKTHGHRQKERAVQHQKELPSPLPKIDTARNANMQSINHSIDHAL